MLKYTIRGVIVMKKKMIYVIALLLFIILTIFRKVFNFNDLQSSTAVLFIILLIGILKLIVAKNDS